MRTITSKNAEFNIAQETITEFHGEILLIPLIVLKKKNTTNDSLTLNPFLPMER
jgi:hypothetical protein